MKTFHRLAALAFVVLGMALLAGTIHEYSQYGGKYHRSTYWCEDSQRNITDLWFENTDKGYRDV